jgi:hypothetical protein
VHGRDVYQPRCDPHLEERILVLLHRAGGETLDLCLALGAFPSASNRAAVKDIVARLNRRGFVRIVGVPGWGHRLVRARRGGARIVKA